ncbi:MAG: family 16 glycosylhydrolase [Ktedonobacterales bacterium]
MADDFTAWHTYSLEWRPQRADFWVDGAHILTAAQPPAGPLGFVAWIDNQYAVATPRGSFRFGTLSGDPQWLELDHIHITPL